MQDRRPRCASARAAVRAWWPARRKLLKMLRPKGAPISQKLATRRKVATARLVGVRTRGLQGPLSVFSLPLECGREERRRGAREARTHLHGTLLQMHPQRMRRHCELALAKCPRTLANAPAAHTQRTALVTCRSPTRRTRGGHEEDTRRTRGGHEEGTRRTRGGHEEDRLAQSTRARQ